MLDKLFPSANILMGGAVRTKSITIPMDPKTRGIKDGKAMLRLVVRDYSWRKWGGGNQHYEEHAVMIDTRAPQIDVVDAALNMSQGGAGVVVYTLSEECPTSGVNVGDHHYPGYGGHFNDTKTHMAFIALDHRQGKNTSIAVIASDFAGNQGTAGVPRHINAKRFKKDKIRISDNFLSAKMPEFRSQVPTETGIAPLEIFLRVNRALRQKNYETITKIVSKTDPKVYWKGAFTRLPGSANRAGYADYREYIYNQKRIDQQTHLGIDLASLKNAPVPAANSGKVVFADSLGIYGRCIFIDHGFGVFSMYAHLSQIAVEEDQMVAKGDIIGKTGKSGLAGGDHLHFSMLVNNTFVNPIEWWDATWIRNNILSKIESAD
jgi:murein DD-endopeptidase MepM/ murein hydrolase activator NlpD